MSYFILRPYKFFLSIVGRGFIRNNALKESNGIILGGILLKVRTKNGERRTGVWERVYSDNPHEKSKRRKNEKKKDWGLLFGHALFELDCRRKYHGQ